ncbi:MAG: S41 family peptidase [Aridibacter famidurans]|nr:S41 family peptidase [Aridibacter famidurans]
MIKPALATILLLLFSSAAYSQFRTLQPVELKQDFILMKKALTELHPGLYRYSPPEGMARRFDEFEAKLSEPMREDRFLILISQFLAEIRCGHTYVNPLNQKKDVFERFTNGRTYFPFYFRIQSYWELVVTENASGEDIPPGSRIFSINGIETEKFVPTLFSVVSVDGRGGGFEREAALEVKRNNDSVPSLFDIYFPLFFPAKDGTFTLEVITPGSIERRSFTVHAMTLEERTAEMEKRYGESPSYDDGWKYSRLKDGIGYLKLDHFITWKLSFDHRKFLADSFRRLKSEGAKNLVIDIREAEGGDSSLVNEVLRYLHREPFPCDSGFKSYFRSAKADPLLLDYADIYDEELKSALTNGVPKKFYKDTRTGLLEFLGAGTDCKRIEPYSDRFDGKVYLLVGPANASAAFTLAKRIKDAGLATLVGRRTGGNVAGFSGGTYIFFRLPNSGFEFDIPFFAYLPEDDKMIPDRGVHPDVVADVSAEDIADRRDGVLERVLSLIDHEKRRPK